MGQRVSDAEEEAKYKLGASELGESRWCKRVTLLVIVISSKKALPTSPGVYL